MFRRDQTRATVGGRWIAIRLLAFALLLGAAFPSQAATLLCSEFPNGVVDGSIPADRAAMDNATTFGIDRDCTIRNFPQSNPLDLTLINFNFPQQASYLIIFDNVFYIGGMSCNDPTQSDFWIWWVNGSYNSISGSCQDFVLPVDSINKQNPSGTTTASVGIPFTYTLTFPELVVLTDSGYVGTGAADPEDLHNVIIWDDLTTTGAALTYVSNNAYLINPDSSTTPIGPLNVNTTDNKVLEFSYVNNPALATIPKQSKLVIELTVVLDDSPVNAPNTQFINTATWQFSKAIDLNNDGVIDPSEIFEPLPGQDGVTAPMTIAAPNLVVNKTGSETAVNLGVDVTFTIDVQNTGGADAWNVTVLDNLPPFSAGAGMCEYDPSATVTARIVAADGVTTVRNLTPGTDYSLNYTGPSGTPACQLSLTMTNAAGAIAPNQHLVITYVTQLDPLTTETGVPLTNVAGATEWFTAADGAYTYPRHRFSRTLTDGTPTVVDHQDNYTLTTGLSGYYFQKTVWDLTSNVNPASTAVAGDVLRYRVRLFNITAAVNGISITDTLDPTRFDLNTFQWVSPLPAGVIRNFNNATGEWEVMGASGTPLNLVPPAELVIEFDITLRTTLANGDTVVNQSHLTTTSGITADSDDPYVNGVAPPGMPGDPTVVTIVTPGALSKANSQPSAAPGERFTYRITVPAAPVNMPLYDVRILDDLTASAADLRFVSASVVSGGSWTLSNAGTDTAPIIVDAITGIDIPAGGQAVIDITVELLNTLDNNSGLAFSNSASYTYNRTNGSAATQQNGGAGSTADMTVVEPAVTAATKAVANVTAGKPPTDPAAAGDILEYTVTVPNSGSSTAFDTTVVDTLPVNVSLVAGSATAQINSVAVAGFIADPTTLPGGALAWGGANGDGSLDIPAGQSLVLTYRVTVGSINGAPINNTVYIDWTSLNGGYPTDPFPGRERTGAGCPTTTDPNDYCFGPVTASFPTVDTTTVAKTVVSDTWNSGLSTGTDAILRIGDTVVYRLALTLREGLTGNVVVTDTLPAGLAFDGVVSVNGDASAPYAAAAPFSYADIPATSVPSSGQTGAVTWTLGDITNAIDNNAANDTLVIEYRVLVVKNTLAHVPSTSLTNSVAVTYTGSAPSSPQLGSSATIEVRQPVMSTPTKIAAGYTSPAIINDITTEVMPFHLESCNTITIGLAPAYSLMLTDQLATQLDETSITTPQVRVGGTLLTAGTDYTYTPPAVRGGTMVFVLNVPVNPGQCVTVDYSIGFYTDFGPDQTWTNSVTLDEYWSLQVPTTTGQRYGPLGPGVFTMTNGTTISSPIKTLLSPAGNEATIGQEVVYRIAVPGTPINATLYDVVITDTLNAALEYVSVTDVSGNSLVITNNTVPPGQVSLTIAQIPTGQQAIIELRARVANNVSANAGLSFANSASYTYAASPGGVQQPGGSDSTDQPLAIVEPLVNVTKAVVPATPPSVGDTLTYTLTLAAAGGTASDIFSNAYDVSLVDTLSLGLDYVEGTATLNGAPLADPTVTGDGVNSPQVLTWNTGFDITEGTAPVVTYQVQVLAGVGANQLLRNDVRVEWTSLDGASAYERIGTGSPAYNDYFDTAYTELTTPLPTALSKQNPATTTVTIGQPFTYTITVPQTASATALYDVKIIDNLPAGVQFVSVAKLSTWGSWTPTNSGTATSVVITDAGGIGIDVPAGQQIEIALTVVLTDDLVTNYSGRQFSNTASYTFNKINDDSGTELTGGSGTTGNLTIAGPDTLIMDKSGPATMSLDVPGTFTLSVRNAGTGTAWDLTVTDLLPNPTPGGMCDATPTNVTAQMYMPDGTTPVGGALAAGSDFTASFAAAPSCTLTITMQSTAGAIPAGYWLRITYQALLDGDNANDVPITNVAGATRWYGADPAPGITPHTYTRVLTNGTVGTADHEDAHTVTPVIPLNGVVYDSVTRQPIAGATVTMLRASTGTALPAACFDDPAQQNQLTNTYGHYSFELNFSQPECPSGADYLITVTAAPSGYDASAPSRIIPPTTSASTAAYSVPLCPADAVPATGDRCEAQANSVAPTGAASTTYYLHLTLSTNTIDNSYTPPVTIYNNQIFNNHIPIDPEIEAAITITKISPLVNVTRGQLVPYTITIRNTYGGTLADLAVVDTLPPGFKYVEGSSRFDGSPVTPVVLGNGRQLRWENLTLGFDQTHTIKLLLVVGGGVGEGDYVNQAQVFSTTVGGPASVIATATVRVKPDPMVDCTDIIGKVFKDTNGNGYPDEGEGGVAGARVVSARGLITTTDRHGRYHITCAAVPNESRGSNFILKLDERSLPSGYRVTTENPLVKRATRGKMIKYNFGAAPHRVVRLDISDAVFEPKTTDMRPQWQPRLGILLEELKKAPSILRLSYLADVEEPALAQRRLDSIKREVAARWKEPGNGYALTIETEIYWRRGGPPDRSRVSND